MGAGVVTSGEVHGFVKLRVLASGKPLGSNLPFSLAGLDRATANEAVQARQLRKPLAALTVTCRSRHIGVADIRIPKACSSVQEDGMHGRLLSTNLVQEHPGYRRVRCKTRERGGLLGRASNRCMLYRIGFLGARAD